MSKKSRLSRNQKRQQKLAKRDRRQSEDSSLAYTGNRYKTVELVKPLFETEMGIYEAFVVSGRKLTDDDVEDELEELIGALRERPAAELIFPKSDDGRPAGLVPAAILPHWEQMLGNRKLPARDDLIGILRTIFGSLETWRSRSASSRGYLNYLEGFMNKMGVRVQLANDEWEPVPEPPADELAEEGGMWLAVSPEAPHRFTALANELLEQGHSQRVVDACQKLLGSIGTPT